MAWPAVKLGFTQSEFAIYLQHQVHFGAWRPSLIVWHNTAAPTLADWHKTAADDIKRGRKPGTTRINNLENYFRNQRRWSGAPHLFIADDFIWVFNPLTAPGVHSPSWNHLSIGIEMIADFSKEDDDSGAGLKVKNNTIFATALLCETFGLDPHMAIKLHKDDKKTDHDCPGVDFALDRQKNIAAVAALLSGGEHSANDISDAINGEVIAFKPFKSGAVNTNDLTLRAGPGVSNQKIGSLDKGAPLGILDTAKNGTTEWLLVETTLGKGWVAARFVTIAK